MVDWGCATSLSESTKTLIETRIKNYAEIVSVSIDDRFPPETLVILQAFSNFDATQIRSEFCQAEIIKLLVT